MVQKRNVEKNSGLNPKSKVEKLISELVTKMVKRFILALLLCNALSFSFGQNTREEIIKVRGEEKNNTLFVDFRLPKFEILDTTFKELYNIDEIFNYIRIDDEFGIIDSVGLPQLPQLTFDLHVPYNAEGFSIGVISETKYEIDVKRRIMPAQEDINEKEPVFNFQINNAYYDSFGGFCDSLIQLTDNFIVFGEQGICVTISPFVYNPILKKITILSNVTFRVSYTLSREVTETYYSEAKESYLGSLFKNYQSSEIKSHQKSGGSSIMGRYLMITPIEYESTLTYFANYKRNIGFDVVVVNTNTTGSSASSIKNYIQNQYNNTSTRPDYVLLVGDVDKIPASDGDVNGDYSDPLTDLNYVLLDGKDLFADAFLGRFSVSSTNELKNIINKTVFMEMNMHRFNKTAVLLAGGGNGENQFVKPQNTVKNDILIPMGFQCDYFYAKDGATQADGINALNGNYMFFIYRGHGGKTLIGSPFLLDRYDINYSTNTIYPMGFSFACLTNSYGYSECLGESWIRSSKGGICFFGATTTTYRYTNNVIEVKVFEKMYSQDCLASCINLGMRKFLSNANTILRQKHVKSYNFLGDPSFNLSGIGCKQSFTFNNPEVFKSGAEITYRANDFIQNNNDFIIESGAKVKLLAGNSIILKPGFKAEAGSNVEIKIVPCDDGTIQKSFSQDDSTEEIFESIENVIEQKTDELINPAMFSIFPNPTNDDFSLAYTLESYSFVQIDLYNMSGSFIKNFLQLPQQEAGIYYYNFSLSGLPSGLYLLVFKTDSKTISNKIIKH